MESLFVNPENTVGNNTVSIVACSCSQTLKNVRAVLARMERRVQMGSMVTLVTVKPDLPGHSVKQVLHSFIS